MRIIMYLAGIIVFLLMAGMLYVRLAPTDVARWHQPIEAAQSADLADGAIRVIAADEQSFERVAQAATSLPRTEVVAGSVAEDRITFRTRSKWIGFPDFTTIEYDNGMLKMYARLRFGQSDMGVNAARLEKLLGASQSG